MSLYLDANIFIFASQGTHEDPRTRKAQEILEGVVDGKEIGFTSVLTIDEVMWVIIKRKKDRVLALEQGARLHQIPIRLLPLTPSISISAIRLMRKYQHLNPRDALHAASAIDCHADRLISDDSDFKMIEEIQCTPL